MAKNTQKWIIGIFVVLSVIALVIAGFVWNARHKENFYKGLPIVKALSKKVAKSTTAENALPGTQNWKGGKLAQKEDVISGFPNQISAPVGTMVPLKVQTTAEKFSVAVYRLGWYGGTGGRLVAESKDIKGVKQPKCNFLEKTRTVDCSNWSTVAYLDTKYWPSGMYVIRMTTNDGESALAPYVAEANSYAGKEIVLNSTATWEAYNYFAKQSLYNGNDRTPKTRSRMVTFQRPFAPFNYKYFFDYEGGMVQWMEKQGVDLAYASSYTMEKGAKHFQGARALLALGHDEYWSRNMRATLDGMISDGVNVAFLGANNIWWRIRWNEDGSAFTCYRYPEEDPVKMSPDTTANYVSDPFPDPSARTIGADYACADPKATWKMQVVDPNFFLFKGINEADMRGLEHLVTGEMDVAGTGTTAPKNLQVLTHSPIECYGKPAYADMTYYSAPSGAAVLDAGTFGLAFAFSPAKIAERKFTPADIAFSKQFVANVVRDFQQPKLGEKYPSVSNVLQLNAQEPKAPTAPTLKGSLKDQMLTLTGTVPSGTTLHVYVNSNDETAKAKINGSNWSLTLPIKAPIVKATAWTSNPQGGRSEAEYLEFHQEEAPQNAQK